MDAIDGTYSIGLDFGLSNLKNLSEEFAGIYQPSATVFDGIVLALDGWVMRTRQPYRSEVDNVNSYRNRKGCWGIVVLAGCDATTKFHLFNADNTGSTNDCTAWDRSKLKELVDSGK